MNKQVLKFKLGEEYKARVEKPEEFGESLFRDTYENGYKAVDTIITSHREDTNGDYEKYNNIIAFVGERGTGKTSCMISFAESLKKLDEVKGVEKECFEKLKKNKGEYILTDVIDPSLLAENSNILEIVLANMFKSFKEEVGNKIDKQDKKREVLTAFTEVYDNLKTIYSSKEVLFKNDGIDALLKLSASSDLKKNMTKLVEKYLEFIVDDNEKEKTLIIQVDDIDLNTKHAYEMVEQIRKYLIIPNVIILMAVKLDQLSDIIKQNYLVEYKESLEREEVSTEEVSNMVERYLEKLIPEERRILEQGIRELIYIKTGFLFLGGEEGISHIVPKSLRGLINFIAIFLTCKE